MSTSRMVSGLREEVRGCVVERPVGLENKNNVCYLNASLQINCATAPLLKTVTSHSPLDCVRCSEKEFCLTNALKEHVQRVSANPHYTHNTTALQDNLSAIASGFKLGQQQDATEWYFSFIDTLCEQNPELAGVFKGQHGRTIVCDGCKEPSRNSEVFADIPMDIMTMPGKTCDITTGLMQLIQPELIDIYRCGQCNSNEYSARKSLLIRQPPEILTIRLNRFNPFKDNLKINKLVHYPETLDISDYMEARPSQPKLYDLYGVLVHKGAFSNSGHYFSFVKYENQWYRADDTRVKPVNETSVLKQSGAYLLFYQSRNVKEARKDAVKSNQDNKMNKIIDSNCKKMAVKTVVAKEVKNTVKLRKNVQNKLSKMSCNNTVIASQAQFSHCERDVIASEAEVSHCEGNVIASKAQVSHCESAVIASQAKVSHCQSAVIASQAQVSRENAVIASQAQVSRESAVIASQTQVSRESAIIASQAQVSRCESAIIASQAQVSRCESAVIASQAQVSKAQVSHCESTVKTPVTCKFAKPTVFQSNANAHNLAGVIPSFGGVTTPSISSTLTSFPKCTQYVSSGSLAPKPTAVHQPISLGNIGHKRPVPIENGHIYSKVAAVGLNRNGCKIMPNFQLQLSALSNNRMSQCITVGTDMSMTMRMKFTTQKPMMSYSIPVKMPQKRRFDDIVDIRDGFGVKRQRIEVKRTHQGMIVRQGVKRKAVYEYVNQPAMIKVMRLDNNVHV